MRADNRFEPLGESNSVSAGIEVLRRRWPIALAIVLVCTILSAIQQKRATPTYKSTAQVAFQNSTIAGEAVGFTSSGTEPQREADTQVEIAHSPEVAQAVRTELGSSKSPDELLEMVSIEAAPNADVLNITASAGDPHESARIANAFATQYITFRANSQLTAIDAAKSQLQQQLATTTPGTANAASLEQQIQRLTQARAVVGSGATSSDARHRRDRPRARTSRRRSSSAW